jgi:hypothetical protein
MSQHAGLCGEQCCQLLNSFCYERKLVPSSMEVGDGEKVKVDIGGRCWYSQALDEGMLSIACIRTSDRLHSPSVGLDDRFGLSRKWVGSVQLVEGSTFDIFHYADLELLNACIREYSWHRNAVLSGYFHHVELLANCSNHLAGWADFVVDNFVADAIFDARFVGVPGLAGEAFVNHL